MTKKMTLKQFKSILEDVDIEFDYMKILGTIEHAAWLDSRADAELGCEFAAAQDKKRALALHKHLNKLGYYDWIDEAINK